MSKMICEIFRSPKEEGMYLYVEKSVGLKNVPELLMEKFGRPAAGMALLLTEDKKLARADAKKVLAAIKENGFYLQLPPPKDAYMQEIHNNNTKMF